MRLGVFVDVAATPFQQRADLPQIVAIVPRYGLAVRSFRRLLATHAGHPRLLARDRAAKRFAFADLAARLPLFEPQIEAVDTVVPHECLDCGGVRKIDVQTTLITT